MSFLDGIARTSLSLTRGLRLTRPAVARIVPSAVSVPRYAHPRLAFETQRRTFIMQRDIVNFYSGQPPLNRLSFMRNDAEKLNGFLPNAKFLLFRKGNPLMSTGDNSRILFLTYPQVEAYLGGQFGTAPPEVTDNRAKKVWESVRLPNTLPGLVFVGVDERDVAKSEDLNNPTGVPYFALDATNLGFDTAAVNGEWGESRASAALMSPWEAGVFASARPLIDWNGRHHYCQACGSKTYSLWAGWKRACITAIEPVPGKKPCFSTTGLHNFCYPRTDPVIIMGILDPTGDKMLLGRQKGWPKGFYSCLAGFIEPGESFEEAVRREVLEEAGIEVGPVSYSSSQPWPYPSSLMVGCFGRAREGQKIRLDLDNELEHAEWYPREVVARMATTKAGSHFSKGDFKQLDKSSKGKLDVDGIACEHVVDPYASFTRMPPETAIAGQLMRQWALGAHAIHLVSNL